MGLSYLDRPENCPCGSQDIGGDGIVHGFLSSSVSLGIGGLSIKRQNDAAGRYCIAPCTLYQIVIFFSKASTTVIGKRLCEKSIAFEQANQPEVRAKRDPQRDKIIGISDNFN